MHDTPPLAPLPHALLLFEKTLQQIEDRADQGLAHYTCAIYVERTALSIILQAALNDVRQLARLGRASITPTAEESSSAVVPDEALIARYTSSS